MTFKLLLLLLGVAQACPIHLESPVLKGRSIKVFLGQPAHNVADKVLLFSPLGLSAPGAVFYLINDEGKLEPGAVFPSAEEFETPFELGCDPGPHGPIAVATQSKSKLKADLAFGGAEVPQAVQYLQPKAVEKPAIVQCALPRKKGTWRLGQLAGYRIAELGATVYFVNWWTPLHSKKVPDAVRCEFHETQVLVSDTHQCFPLGTNWVASTLRAPHPLECSGAPNTARRNLLIADELAAGFEFAGPGRAGSRPTERWLELYLHRDSRRFVRLVRLNDKLKPVWIHDFDDGGL